MEFKLNRKESEMASDFVQNHLSCAKKHPTTIGGHITYEITPTSIGNAVIVKCSLCGKQENITDYDAW